MEPSSVDSMPWFDSMLQADLGAYDVMLEKETAAPKEMAAAANDVDKKQSKHNQCFAGIRLADSLVKELAPYLHNLTDEFGPDMPEFESLEEDSGSSSDSSDDEDDGNDDADGGATWNAHLSPCADHLVREK